MKKPFSEPKIYTGGIDTSKWSALSENEKQKALAKRWYVYFSYRHPETGKLERQTPISKDANQYNTMRDRLAELRVLQRNLLYLLERGASPYGDNTELAGSIIPSTNTKQKLQHLPYPGKNATNTAGVAIHYSLPAAAKSAATVYNEPSTFSLLLPSTEYEQSAVHHSKSPVNKGDSHPPGRQNPATVKTLQPSERSVAPMNVPGISSGETSAVLPEVYTIEQAIELGLAIKKRIQGEGSYPKFKSPVNQFKEWLEKQGMKDAPVTSVDKRMVIRYLNEVLQRTSPRTRNNSRGALSALFQVWEDNELIPDNFVKKINVLRAVPTRHKSYTPEQEVKIFEYLKDNDPHLLLFIQFVAYGFLRPIEVCRLTVGDVDIKDRKLYVKAKNSPVKIKLIPEILIREIPSLEGKLPNDYFFTANGFGGPWETSEDNKRNYFSKRFKDVKEALGLGKNYGLYSFRHTYISKVYRELAKGAAPMEVKSKLMLITGHTTLTALEKYLREIDAVLPEDFSHLLNKH